MSNNVVFCSSGNYGEMAVRLFKTIKHAWPNANMYFESVKCDAIPISRMSALGVTVESGFNIPEEWKDFPLDVICKGWRAVMLARLLDKGWPIVVYMDSDSVVLERFDDLLDEINSFDIAVPHNEDNHRNYRRRVISGFQVLRNTDKSLVLLRSYFKYITSDIMRNGMWADQPCLWKAICESGVKMLGLDPMTYINWKGGRARVVAWGRDHKHSKWDELSKWAENLIPG